jgi:Kdo2-lipid IVA lauroyltransferase/acyltransferase
VRSSPSAVFDAADVGLARRRPRRKGSRLRYAAEHFLFRVVSAALRLLPRRLATRLGSGAARLYVRIARGRRRILLANLARAFPEKSAGEIGRIARASVEGFGAAVIEFLDVSRWSAEDVRARVVCDGVENFQAARSRGKGVVLLSAHFGNWELGALAAGLLFEPIFPVVRPLDNPGLERELSRRRARFGNSVIAKKEALREMLRALRQGRTIAILIDQNVQADEAAFVPFFGRLAATSPSLALVQRKTEAAVVPVFTWPLGDGRYRLVFETPIYAEEFADVEGGRTEQVRRATARYTQTTEDAIRRQPSAWLWMHDRWKTSPPLAR